MSFVLISHLGVPALFSKDGAARRLVESLGVGGVDLFFVISGLLITHIILVEEERFGHFSLRFFYARRAVRILPPAYLYLGFLALCTALGLASITATDFLLCIGFCRNWSSYCSAETGHLWSLSIEEQFYLVWPAFLFVIRSSRVRIIVAASAIAMAPIYRVAWEVLAGPVSGPLSIWRTDLHFQGIISGCLLALMRHDTTCFEWLRRPTLNNAAVTGLACAGFVVALWFPGQHPSYRPFTAAALETAKVAALCIVLNFIVFNRRSMIGQLANWEPLAWVGRMSYSIYLWQQFFSVVQWEPWIPPMKSGWIRSFPFDILLTLLAASASYYLIERPLFRLRAKLRPYERNLDGLHCNRVPD